ncbi:MAG: DNA alkylation repair protein [Candidatus Aenigmarchaeota archaeon]|nr:DNA alkylation repair protein [Candidatus Aenigmarchaeota archaeon]
MLKIMKELEAAGNPERAKVYSKFFKTGKGEYGEGDVFLGITVPEQRKISRKYPSASFGDLERLLSSNIHEHRLTALLVLVEKYRKSDEKARKMVFDFCMKNISGINSWDLVDTAAPSVIGGHLLDRDRSILYKLAKGGLWERRIAIVSTYAFIKNGALDDTFRIAEMLLDDEHDLIHKAVGWMLREVGKRNTDILEKFLLKNSRRMPRTMLRYAIERFPERKRKFYMKLS